MSTPEELRTEYHQEELDEFVSLHSEMLEAGFTSCDVKLPTKTWHGVRVEAYAELDDAEPLPYINPEPSQTHLIAWTLSGIDFNVGLGRPNKPLPSRIREKSHHGTIYLPELVIDEDIKDCMARMAKLGRELAYMGLGFPEEYPWIKPMGFIDPSVVLCDDNEPRRYKETVLEATDTRRQYWEERGWWYSIRWPFEDIISSGVVLQRFAEFNPEEGSLDNRLLSIKCGEGQVVTAVLLPDVGPPCPIDPHGPLTLEELAQLQKHTQAEFESGSLNPDYIAMS